jgi:hypothetical protein
MTILADEHGGTDPFAVLEYALDPTPPTKCCS